MEYYCEPCYEELPILEDLKAKTNSNQVVYVTFCTKNYEELKKRLERKTFSFDIEKISSDDLRNALCNIYRLQRNSIIEECYLPSTFLIDTEKNEIVAASLGKMDDNTIFVQLINGKKLQ